MSNIYQIKALGNGCTLSTSRLDEVERTIRAFYDDMDKRKQESHVRLIMFYHERA